MYKKKCNHSFMVKLIFGLSLQKNWLLSYSLKNFSRILIYLLTSIIILIHPQLLVHDPSKRLPLGGVLAHPWIRNNAQAPEMQSTCSYTATKH